MHNHLRLVGSNELGSARAEITLKAEDADAIAQVRSQLAETNAASVLNMRQFDDKDPAHSNWPVDMEKAPLVDFTSSSDAKATIVLQGLVQKLAEKGKILSPEKRAALNNYVARKVWNMPATTAALVVVESEDLEALQHELSKKVEVLLVSHLGSELVNLVDTLAQKITVHWLSDQTTYLKKLEELARNKAREYAQEQKWGGLAFLENLSLIRGISIDGNVKPVPANVVSMGDFKDKVAGRVDSVQAGLAVDEFKKILASDSYPSMRILAANHTNPLICRAALAEADARTFIRQEKAKAGIAYMQAFVKNEIEALLV